MGREGKGRDWEEKGKGGTGKREGRVGLGSLCVCGVQLV